VKSGTVPQFGVLQGVRVLSSGSALAGPVAATLMAELGANVIHVESASRPDTVRAGPLTWSCEHRNQRTVALDIPTDAGREVFRRLLAWAQIWIESSKPGTYGKWGFTDPAVWGVNPILVMVHISGYGQYGDAEYVSRPGYDGTAQAFSGYMNWNGMPEPSPPLRVKPFTGDYVPPLFAAFAAVSALHRALSTGTGESIDLAQYEAMLRIQGNYLLDFLNNGTVTERTGNQEGSWSVYDVFKCADDRDVLVIVQGGAMWERALPILGLLGDPDFPQGFVMATKPGSAADKADKAVAEFCLSRSAADAERELNDAGIACSQVVHPTDMVNHPHYEARESIVEWCDPLSDGHVKGPAIVPRFTNHPTQVWRSGPGFGEDSEDILAELGYSPNQCQALVEQGVIKVAAP
jgi:L-carnitine CoA-transferase